MSAGGPRRPRARRGEGEQLREEILDAAHALLLETGSSDKVSTRAVAQRVGCTSPSLYLHFPDRAALLFAVCERQFELLGARLDEATADVDGAVAALRVLAHTYAAFAIEHPEEYRVMMMVPDVGGLWSPAWEDLAAETGFARAAELVAAGMAAGELRDGDPIRTTLTMWAAVHGLVAVQIAKPAFPWPPLAERVDQLLDVFLDGMRPRPPARASRSRPRSPRRSTAT